MITLCHGTSAKHLKRIRKEGLRPRGVKSSEWADCPSHPKRVYLTDAYAMYFAVNATKDGDDLLIVEVEVDERRLYPDEYYLAQAEQLNGNKIKLMERTKEIRDILEYETRSELDRLYKASLEFLGTVSHYRTIKPSQIRRVAIIPASEAGRLIITEFDPSISIVNYRFCGEDHRRFQESLFSRFPEQKRTTSLPRKARSHDRR